MQNQPQVEYYCSNRFKANRHMRDLDCKAITHDAILSILKSSNDFIESIHKRILAYNTWTAEEYWNVYRSGIHVSDTSWPNFLTIMSVNSAQDDNLDKRLNMLASMTSENSKAISRVENGQTLEQFVYLTDPIVGVGIGVRGVGNIGSIFSVHMVNGERCDNCSIIREKTQMQKHKLHPECLIESDRQRMKELGYEKIQNMEDIISVRASGVTHEKVSEFWGFYVPKWVGEAIKSYRKADAEYAGMTLEEFLAAMNPDKKP